MDPDPRPTDDQPSHDQPPGDGGRPEQAPPGGTPPEARREVEQTIRSISRLEESNDPPLPRTVSPGE